MRTFYDKFTELQKHCIKNRVVFYFTYQPQLDQGEFFGISLRLPSKELATFYGYDEDAVINRAWSYIYNEESKEEEGDDSDLL